MDWKEALLRQSREMGIEPTESPDSPTAETPTERPMPENSPVQKEPVHIAFERKGRAGKTATIIHGFTCSDDQLRDIAATLKSKLGTGGSARGGEILIQGDRREKVAELLRNMGYKVTGA